MALTTLSANSVTDEHLEVLRQLLDSKNEVLRRHGLDDGAGSGAPVQLTHELPPSLAEWLLSTALERGLSVSDFLTELVERERGAVSAAVPVPQRVVADGAEWFSIQQLAEATGVPANTVYGLIGKPDGPFPVRLGPKGGRYLVHRVEAQRFAQARGRVLAA
ncbi:DNA-binding protein [Streptomyces sp. MJM8645]|uniref:helix-turn-helix transcriptional regulator n=1 Tax=Streptomycetaceae TaxID=2062 RepID=UPI0007AF4594|nr:DNA-binding protein [Streptomyces sp. MJM8645]